MSILKVNKIEPVAETLVIEGVKDLTLSGGLNVGTTGAGPGEIKASANISGVDVTASGAVYGVLDALKSYTWSASSSNGAWLTLPDVLGTFVVAGYPNNQYGPATFVYHRWRHYDSGLVTVTIVGGDHTGDAVNWRVTGNNVEVSSSWTTPNFCAFYLRGICAIK